MNAKQVLEKVMTALSLVKEEVILTSAQTADGTILDSPTFDLGEPVEVVSEDGTKAPAPDGEYAIVLKDESGNDVNIRVVVADGKISERENVEEAQPETEPTEMASLAGDDISSPMTPEATSQTPQDIPQTMDKLSARIDELEKKFMDMISEKETTEPKKAEQVEVGDNSSQMSAVELAAEPDEEEELPKLDGAPIDDEPKPLNKFGKKVSNPQSTFLSKLYK